MVMAGDFQGSPNKYLAATMAILNQNFPDIVQIKNMGIAMVLPAMQSHDLNMGLPRPIVSHKIPPITDDEKPQTTTASAYKLAKVACYYGKVRIKYMGK